MLCDNERFQPLTIITKHSTLNVAAALDPPLNRKQKTKIGLAFGSWYGISAGVSKGSVLEPLLFNILINDLFFSITKSKVCNFADDNRL